MIIELRNALQSYAIKVFLWVVLIFLAIFFSPVLFRLNDTQKALLTINKDSIEHGAIEQRMALLSSVAQPSKAGVLQMLIQETLLDQVGRQLGIEVGTDYIEEKVQDPYFIISYLLGIVPWELVTQHGINTAALPQVLRHYNMTVASLERALEAAVKRSFVQELVAAATYVPQAQIKQAYERMYSKRTYSLVKVPYAQVYKALEKTGVSADELERYYKKEKKNYTTPEKRVLQGWVIPRSSYELPVSPAQIEQYYVAQKAKKYTESPAQVQIRRILVAAPQSADAAVQEAARKKAQQVQERVKKEPGKFAQIAQEVSDDETTNKKGGLVGWVQRAQDSTDPVSAAAFKLKEDGAVSEVIKTDKGYEIVQRVARKAVQYKPLESVRAEIQNLLQQQAFTKQFTQDMNRLVHKEEKQEQTAAIEKYVASHKAVPMTKTVTKGEPGVLEERAFRIGRGDWAYRVEGDQGMVFSVQSVIAPAIPELASVQARVKQDFLRDKAHETLKTLLQEMVDKQDSTLAKQYMSTNRTIGPVAGMEQAEWQKLSGEGIPVSQMLEQERVGAVSWGLDNEGNGYYMRLDARDAVDAGKYQEAQQSIRNEVYKQQQALGLRSFVASLYRNAKIQSKESLFTAIQ